MDLLQYDYSGCLIDDTGLAESDYAELESALDAVRSETLADVELWNSGGEVPAEKQPLDAAFIELPDKLLADYAEHRDDSELGQ
ncbi:MAG: hypothetical protein MI757_13130, partial [Pirellulales bacterium]|nr:hypothetical protein [Pirellulales bacterium]